MPITILEDFRHETADFPLDPTALKALWRMEEHHFWHSARNKWIAKALLSHGAPPPGRVLEVGCGSGWVARHLVERGYHVTGVDTAEVLVRKANDRCPAADFVCTRLENLPSAFRGPYDIIGLFDVLEHLDHPEDLLDLSLSVAKPGALVIATVPALRTLHTIIDDISGHKKRYELGELPQVFRNCGIEQVAEYGIFRLLIPMLRRHRGHFSKTAEAELTPKEARDLQVENLQVPNVILNKLLESLCAIECITGFRNAMNRRGASLLVIGRTASKVRSN